MEDILDRNMNCSTEKHKRQRGGYCVTAKVTVMGQTEGDRFKRQVAAHVTKC